MKKIILLFLAIGIIFRNFANSNRKDALNKTSEPKDSPKERFGNKIKEVQQLLIINPQYNR